MSKKPVIGISMGDAAGVGPELCLHALRDAIILKHCTPVVFGSLPLLQRVATRTGLPLPPETTPAATWTGAVPATGGLVLDCPGLDCNSVQPGAIQRACGTAAYDYIQRAIAAASDHRTQAIVTAPIHKEALQQAGVPFPGHTEMLAAHTGTRDVCMMMTADAITVSLVTTHIALSDVPAALTESRITTVINLTIDALHRLGNPTPHLTVCGLNPHAGEHGLFGDADQRVIAPAIANARTHGISIEGPTPPDTAFVPAQREKTDAYIVMYHDQGLIPFKMLAFDVGVNVTLGLPIIRTSVDHGTAFDLAWQGKASPSSMREAIFTAIKLT